jgi:hypothetical protein
MEIHQDKFMDFFYMKDLVTLVEFYILNEAPKETNCSYKDVCTFLYLANFINELDEYKVEIIQKEKGFGKGYYGTHHVLPTPYVGLKQGIKDVYNKLKNEY